jgi:hypothetical protein
MIYFLVEVRHEDSVVTLPGADALAKTPCSEDDPKSNCLPAGPQRGIDV